MKKIRDNKLYVDLEDMFYLGLTDRIMNYKRLDRALEINDIETINYILFKDDIYDFDYINNLSFDEINKI